MPLQSNASAPADDTLLSLALPIFPNWTTPVEGYDGGIPVRAVEGGLRFMVNPWGMMSAGDLLQIFWGSTLAPVWDKFIELDEVDKPVWGTIDTGHIVRGDAQPVFYRVKRLNQVSEDSTPLLNIFVKLDRPGGDDDDQATPGHKYLIHTIPKDIADNGVGPEEADRGVPITILPYPFMRKNDRVRVLWGSQERIVFVEQKHIDDPINHPLIALIDNQMIEKVGDSTGVVVVFQVVDECGNYPDESSPWSASISVLVDLKQNRLEPPIVLDADPVTNVIDLVELGEDDVLVLVNTTGGAFKVNDLIAMTWYGTPAEGSPIIHGPVELPVVRVGVAVTFSIPNATVQAIARGRATVSYVLKSNGAVDRPSKNTSVGVEGEIIQLRAPHVHEAPGGTLDPAVPWANVEIPWYAGRQGSDLLTLIWEATRPGGGRVYYEDARPVGNLPENEPVPRSVGNTEIRRFDGLRVSVFYRVANDDAVIRSVRESQHLLMQVGEVLPQFPAPEVLEVAPGSDVLDPDSVPPTGATLQILFLGTLPGDRMTYYWYGSDSGGSTSDFVDLTSQTAGQKVRFTVPKQYVSNNINGTVVASYSIIRDGVSLGHSFELPLRVGSRELELKPPSIKEAYGNTLPPLEAEQALTAVIPAEGLLLSDRMRVTWTGASGTPAAGSHTTPERPISETGLRIALPVSVLAFSLGKQVTVAYTIVRDGKPHMSLPFLLDIRTLPVSALISPTIEEAGDDDVLDVTKLVGNYTTILALTWPLIATRQQVWMSLEGTNINGEPTHLIIWTGGGYYVNPTWFSQGYWRRSFGTSYLRTLGNNTKLVLKFKAALDQSNQEENAVVFPDRVYTIKANLD